MTRRDTSQEIDEAAAAWVARLDRGPLTDDERGALDAWLDGDVRRQGAFARANAVMARLDSAYPTLEAAYSLRGSAMLRRRLIGGGLAAGFAGVVLVGARSWSAPLVLKSSKGEVRRVPLPDGSNVTLNTASLVKVRYTSRSRDVQLLSGEALFNVAPDPQRPFLVRAGEVSLAGQSGSFVVRKDEQGPVRVLVQGGHVEMTCKGAAAPRLVAANTAAVVPDGDLGGREAPHPVRLDADEVSRRLSWQDGLLSFNGETLAQAASEFARYSSTRIIVDDPALAAETLTGLYASSDPGGFARDVAVSLGARTVSAADGVHILR